MVRFLFISILLVFSLPGMAQDPELGDLANEQEESFLIQPNRIEFEIEDKDGDYTIIPAQEYGLMVVADTRNKTKDSFMWKFHMLDTALNEIWKKEMPIAFGSNFRGYDHSLGNTFLIFETSSYKREDMKLLQFENLTGDSTWYEINTVFPIDLTFFEVVDHTVIMSGFANDRPVVLLYNVHEQKPKVLPGYYGDNSEILDIVTDDLTQTFTVVRSEKLPTRNYTVVTNTYDDQGNELLDIKLDPGADKSFIDGESTTLEDGQQYIAGTYSRKKSEYSRGLYLAKIVNGRQQLVQYHNYADLTNFFSYMRAKRETRIKERIERRKIEDKKIKFNYRLLVHDIIDKGDEYILVGEAYYPKYSNTGVANPFFNSTWDYQRKDWYNPGFLGYKYTHAVVVSFDKAGQVKWDNSFEINDVLSYDLKDYVQVSVEDDQVVLLYIYEGLIRTKIVSGNEVVEGKSFDPVRLSFEYDVLQDSKKELEGLDRWYGKSFYAYGVQEIRNMKNENVKLDRKIFYINKIIY